MRSLGVLALLAVLPGCGERAPAPAPRPQPRTVLVVVVDSLAAGHVSSYGSSRPTTPNLDELARGGVRFARVLAPSSWTLPSVASIFTGLEQERHGLRRLDERLPDDLSTLAELFSAAGYRSVAVLQNPVLAKSTDVRRGFDRSTLLAFDSEEVERAVELAQDELASGAGPLFLYVHLSPPHMPYRPPAPYRHRWTSPGEGPDGSIEACRRVHRAKLAPDHPDTLRLAALYDEHVAYADALVGRLVHALERTRGLGNALVWVTSDHGEAFMEHGSQGHNATVYAEMVRVPGVVAGGAVAGRGVHAGQTGLVDVLPTLVELCGLPAPRQRVAGRSLAHVLRGEERPIAPRTMLASSRYRDDLEALQLALVRGAYKLVWTGATDRTALYDLAEDSGETRDVSGELPERAAALEAELRALYDARRPGEPAGGGAPDASARDGLRALGYADDD